MKALSRRTIQVAGLVMLVLTVSCATGKSRKKDQPAPQTPVPRRVGTVAVVNTSAHFVLIDVGSSAAPAKGGALKSFPPDTNPGEGSETAILTVSPERRRPFVVADIVKGMPHQGDVVFE